MPTNILMPALSPTMTEGKLAKWLKKEGDEVKAGDVIAEIETDKATMEVEAVDEGRLQHILVPEGTDGVKVNAPIAVLLGEGEDPKGHATAKLNFLITLIDHLVSSRSGPRLSRSEPWRRLASAALAKRT